MNQNVQPSSVSNLLGWLAIAITVVASIFALLGGMHLASRNDASVKGLEQILSQKVADLDDKLTKLTLEAITDRKAQENANGNRKEEINSLGQEVENLKGRLTFATRSVAQKEKTRSVWEKGLQGKIDAQAAHILHLTGQLSDKQNQINNLASANQDLREQVASYVGDMIIMKERMDRMENFPMSTILDSIPQKTPPPVLTQEAVSDIVQATDLSGCNCDIDQVRAKIDELRKANQSPEERARERLKQMEQRAQEMGGSRP